MLKVSTFLGETENGPNAIPLFTPADKTFEKTAQPTILPSVSKYIESLTPSKDAQYVLVNAMGASEFYGSNINGDAFPEASLIHCPDNWSGNPLLDKVRAENWPYGFPTFYNAHPYAHHKNKDHTRAFGEVELSLWNPSMKRVELVIRVDKDKCEKFGGVGVWDKLKIGEYPDVSMGTKVPYDTCSICLDWDTYNKAIATFDPSKQKHPGEAALHYHKTVKPIRGLSITRKDYCQHALKLMGKILPDGRKVFVYNDYPRFFDISFVFIGADRTAKVMMKIASEGKAFWHIGSAEAAEKLGYQDEDEKIASVDELKLAFLGKLAKDKESEITKDVVPSQFAGKAVPLLTKTEPYLPKELLNSMGRMPTEKALSTATSMGIILRPQEFQRVVLINLGLPKVADDLDETDTVFSKSDEEDKKVHMGPSHFSAALARLLLPFLASRSSLGPYIEKRVIIISNEGKKNNSHSSLSSPLLHKMGSAYNSYRRDVMEMIANSQDVLSTMTDSQFVKLSSAPATDIFTPLSVAYITNAFMDELEETKTGARRGNLPQRSLNLNVI